MPSLMYSQDRIKAHLDLAKELRKQAEAFEKGSKKYNDLIDQAEFAELDAREEKKRAGGNLRKAGDEMRRAKKWL